MTKLPKLPKRVAGTRLPANAYRAVGIARVPQITDERWDLDEETMRLLLARLRKWQVTTR